MRDAVSSIPWWELGVACTEGAQGLPEAYPSEAATLLVVFAGCTCAMTAGPSCPPPNRCHRG